MSRETLELTPAVQGYLRSLGTREPDLLRELREETADLPGAGMQISPEQGQLLRFLVKALGVRAALEIGVYTGYSGLSVAMELPKGGRWVGCDVNERTTAVARRYFERAGLLDRFELRLGPALDTLAALASESARFDLVFIDADKENYPRYYEQALGLLNPGGVVLLDNVLWGGSVADQTRTDPSTTAIRETNATIHGDDRVDMAMVPIGDGLVLARKRP